MEISIDNKFEEANKRKRFHFNNFCIKYNIFNLNTQINVIEDRLSPHDVLIQMFDKQSYKCSKRYIASVKVRELSSSNLKQFSENGWILESRKFNALKKVSEIDPDKNEILYITFVKNKTLVWNLSVLEEKGLLKKEKKQMNKATMVSRKEKRNKSIYLLKEEWAKEYDYKADEEMYQKSINVEKKMKNKRTGNKLSNLLFG